MTSGPGFGKQGVTTWQGQFAALALVHALAGDADPRAGWRAAVDRVRSGEDAAGVAATVYLPRNTMAGRRAFVGGLLQLAAGTDTLEGERDALLDACRPAATIRALDEDDRAVPVEGDRSRELQARWRTTIVRGAHLLALRGAARCLACKQPMQAEPRRAARADADGRLVRADYCERCTRKPRHERAVVASDVEAIRRVLDDARLRFSGHVGDTPGE